MIAEVVALSQWWPNAEGWLIHSSKSPSGAIGDNQVAKLKSTKPIDQKLLVMASSKLESSGLTWGDGQLLGIEVIDREVAESLSGHSLVSLKLNYLDPITGRGLQDWPKSPPYWRLRFLEEAHEFEDLSGKKKRYVQPANSAPVAYYPANQDWSEILPDPSIPIVITEGELKAAKACKEGFPCIGLGGVDSFQAKRMGVVWLESLDFPNWVGRNVYICYDNDSRTNPNVLAALQRLAEELQARGAHPHVLSLPDLNGPEEKIGLDDYLIHENGGPEEFAELLHESEPLGLSRALFYLNEQYIYVGDPGLIIKESTNGKISAGAFKEHVAAPTIFISREFDNEGNIRTKSVSGAAAWIKWPLRRAVDKLTYFPGKDSFIDLKGVWCYNTWKGWGTTPREGNVSLFLDLLDHIFIGSDKGAKEWFLKWCAYPLQYPGVKLYSDCLIYGRRQGTGKSLIGYTLGKIYGDNFTEINQENLHSGNNDWAENKQFVMGDDVTGSNKREDADMLKKLITQKKLRINIKYVPTYEVPDVINYYFTSNHADAFFLDDDDRRHFIHEVVCSPLDEAFYAEYDLWLDSDGAAAVFDYLLKLDLGDFNPAAPAFRTAAKERMINDVQSDLGGWVRKLLQDPDSVLRLGNIKLSKDLYTNKELLELYDPDRRTGTTANGLGRELRRAGIQQVNGGRPLKTPDGNDRFYAVRAAEKWMAASVDDLVCHVTQQLPSPKQQKY
jgi:hypothetical protein